MAVLIFANGDIENKVWLRPYLDDAVATIAADGGVQHLLSVGHMPDIVIGDMDSLSEGLRLQLETAETQFLAYPPAKDETDLELALRHAVATYDGEVLIFGALGGRLDQTITNILLLTHPSLKGRRVQLVEQYQRAWLIDSDGPGRIAGAIGDKVSLIPLGGDVDMAHTSGLRWPLQDERLDFGVARGVSNEMTAVTATVTIKSGLLLCVHTRHTWDR